MTYIAQLDERHRIFKEDLGKPEAQVDNALYLVESKWELDTSETGSLIMATWWAARERYWVLGHNTE